MPLMETAFRWVLFRLSLGALALLLGALALACLWRALASNVRRCGRAKTMLFFALALQLGIWAGGKGGGDRGSASGGEPPAVHGAGGGLDARVEGGWLRGGSATLRFPDACDVGANEGFGGMPVATNLAITALVRGETSTAVVVSWPCGRRPVDEVIDVYAGTNLFALAKVLSAEVFVCASNALFSVQDSDLAGTNACRAAFITVGDASDADSDGLTDAEERFVYGSNPSAADTDGDTLPDGEEVLCGSSPLSLDTDGDGLNDDVEVGYATSAFGPLWAQFTSFVDLTPVLLTNEHACASLALANPVSVQGETVSNITVSAKGAVFLNRAGHMNEGCAVSAFSFSAPIDAGAVVVAPLSDASLFLKTNAIASCVKVGQADFLGGNSLCVQYENIGRCGEGSLTNNASFQVVFPSVHTNRALLIYRDIVGEAMDGRNAGIGFQTFCGRRLHSVSYLQSGSVASHKVLFLTLGTGTDPANADSDCDGLSDNEEISLGLSPLYVDSDRDGLPDDWELDKGLDPLDAECGVGASGDPDEDGLANIDEYRNGTDPLDADGDTDGDGVSDAAEIQQESDPTDASDGGIAPDPAQFRELSFNINGDYAAWEMTVVGLGPYDMRVRKISMGAPNAASVTPFKMRKGNAYRLSMRWLNCDGHDDACSPWYCWKATIDGLPSTPCFRDCSDARLPGNEIVFGDGWIAENAEGLLTGHVHESARDGYGAPLPGNVAGKLSATLYVLGDPVLVFDYDRDGAITDAEAAIARAGTKTFRFWINDDSDSGDICSGADYNSDSPFALGRNCLDGVVNGRRDLEDFTPVWIDMRGVFPPGTPPSVRNAVRWELQANCVNAVWTSYSRGEAGSFLKIDRLRCGHSFTESAYEASVVDLDDGVELPGPFLDLLQTSPDKGVFLIEGRGSMPGLTIKAKSDHLGNLVLRSSANLSISSVMDMIRWLCLRSVAGDARTRGKSLGVPANRPDSECDGRHFVFVHGFNVNPDEAVSTGVEMFKRLWQSGLDSMFTVVDWYGDEEQMDGLLANWIFDGTASPDYYANVLHAFQTAGALASETAQLPGTNKVFIAHSLGNILTSAAIKDYSLDYSRYYMLNAAVSMEAYDALEYAEAMVDASWTNVTNAYRAANWHGLFGPDDFRSSLSWKGRFAGITNVVNCYSETEDVVGNIDTNKSLVDQTVWAIQETLKGSSLLHGLNTWPWFDVECEGGWGINTYYTLNPLYYLGGFKPDVNSLAREDVIVHPLFTPFRAESDAMHATNQFVVADADCRYALRARFLGDAIPAEGLAAGANGLKPRSGITGISLMVDCMANEDKWPRKDNQENKLWHHSDWKNLAYPFVYQLFDKIAENDGGG